MISAYGQLRLPKFRLLFYYYIEVFMAMNQSEANVLFHLKNDLYNISNIIVTSNKFLRNEWTLKEFQRLQQL